MVRYRCPDCDYVAVAGTTRIANLVLAEHQEFEHGRVNIFTAPTEDGQDA